MSFRTRMLYSNAEPAAGMPAFTPVPARPAAAPELANPLPKRKQKVAKKPRAKKVSAKKVARKPRTAKAAAAPAQRRGRTAPVTMDVEKAFNLLGSVKRKEIGVVQQIVALINPMPRNSRLRIMQAVATILA